MPTVSDVLAARRERRLARTVENLAMEVRQLDSDVRECLRLLQQVKVVGVVGQPDSLIDRLPDE
jgi:hypothetical protein